MIGEIHANPRGTQFYLPSLRSGGREEQMDVTIRCYILGQAISEALDELSEEPEEEDNEN